MTRKTLTQDDMAHLIPEAMQEINEHGGALFAGRLPSKAVADLARTVAEGNIAQGDNPVTTTALTLIMGLALGYRATMKWIVPEEHESRWEPFADRERALISVALTKVVVDEMKEHDDEGSEVDTATVYDAARLVSEISELTGAGAVSPDLLRELGQLVAHDIASGHDHAEIGAYVKAAEKRGWF